ncbi:MAG TPA: peptidylprolyl isomerase [Solirubrobacterales bacterium]|nr:peptidylprolyl isomerase [Solirubrobacterales bacterium]
MGGEQFDRRWIILGGFAVLAGVIVAVILISRSGGGDSGSTSTTAKGKAVCQEVEQPAPREESLPKPKQTVKKGEKLTAVVETSCGTFDIALATSEAPIIANSFAYLAEEGFYDELTFHRIVPEFVIQGGDPTGTGSGGAGYSVTEKPPANLKYTKGTVAMAKGGTDPPGRAGSQFFVVTGPGGESLPPEYALVGKVSSGMDVVEAIGELGGADEKPTQPVVIDKMSIERG